MICPILSHQLEKERILEDCQKDNCQWWDSKQNDCVIKTISISFKDLNAEIYKGWKSICDRIQSRRQF